MARHEAFRAFWCTRDGVTLEQVDTRESNQGEIKINMDAPLRTGGALLVHGVPDWVDPLVHRVQVEALIDGTPVPLGAYMLNADQVQHSGTHRKTSLTLIDPLQQVYDNPLTEPLVLPEGANIVQWVAAGLTACGVELLDVTPSPTVAQATRVWDMDVERPVAYNEALQMAGYWALRATPKGALQLAPYVLPADRSPLVTWNAGEGSLMLRDWQRTTNLTGIPNRIIVWNSLPGEDDNDQLVTGIASNTNPADRFGIPHRGVVAQSEQADVETQEAAEALARQMLDARSVPTANIELVHALVPGFWGDENLEAYTSGGHHFVGSVNEARLQLKPGALVSSKLREVRFYD